MNPSPFPGKRTIDFKKVGLLSGAIIAVVIVVMVGVKAFSSEDINLKMVSGTEYISGEYGQAIIRLADERGNGISSATCRVTILYPDKTVFMTDASMSPSTERGNYYREFVTPNTTGIYEETIRCSAKKGRTEYKRSVSSSFHVSVALNFVVEMAKVQEERYNELVNKIDQNKAELTALMEQTSDKEQEEIQRYIKQQQETILKTQEEQEQNKIAITAYLEQELQEMYLNVTAGVQELDEKFSVLGDAMAGIFGEG